MEGGRPCIHSPPSSPLPAAEIDEDRSRSARVDGARGRHASHILELMFTHPSQRSLEMRHDIEGSTRSRVFLRRRYFFHHEDEDMFGSSREMDTGEFLPEALFQHLGDGDGSQIGSVRASKASVDAMPIFKFKKQSGQCDDMHCAVCTEAFEADGEVREMPCKHIYHSGCILPWLARNRSCPICRHEMPAEETLPDVTQRHEEGSTLPRGSLEGNGGEFDLVIVGDVGYLIDVHSH